MADQASTKAALFEAIEKTATDVTEYNAQAAAPVLRDLAYAWRALAGGAQPGTSVIQN